MLGKQRFDAGVGHCRSRVGRRKAQNGDGKSNAKRAA
jgi:hypothetical protein